MSWNVYLRKCWKPSLLSVASSAASCWICLRVVLEAALVRALVKALAVVVVVVKVSP